MFRTLGRQSFEAISRKKGVRIAQPSPKRFTNADEVRAVLVPKGPTPAKGHAKQDSLAHLAKQDADLLQSPAFRSTIISADKN